jgi:hypothetical protein
MTNLSQKGKEDVDGIVICSEEKKTKIWIPAWKRAISTKMPVAAAPGTRVKISWYECREQARWKDRIVFKVEESARKV